MARERFYVGSKVRVWKEKGGWDDEPVKVMETFVGILFEQGRGKQSFGIMVLNADGTYSHLQWWIDGAECTLINNDLIANQDFVFSHKEAFKHPDEDEEDEPEDDTL